MTRSAAPPGLPMRAVHRDTHHLTSEVMQVFREFGRAIARLQLATGLRCVPGCGSCCESRNVEATLVEALPLAGEIYRLNEEVKVLDAIDEKDLRGDPVCVLYRPDPDLPGHGRCAYYDFRFLVCRLFGFSARKGKAGTLEFSTCRIIKQRYPEAVSAAESSIRGGQLALSNAEGPVLSNVEGMQIPVYQEAFLRIAGLEPGTGFTRYPVNQAIRKALEGFYWKRLEPVPSEAASL